MFKAGASKPHGLIITYAASGKLIERDTLQCCHCGLHWIVIDGSKRKRGFCPKCMGPTCGPSCSGKCVPIEKRLDQIERGVIR